MENWYQYVTFGKCDIYVRSIWIIFLGENLCSIFTFLYKKLTCEESVRIRHTCEELVYFFSDVRDWYQIFENVNIARALSLCIRTKPLCN